MHGDDYTEEETARRRDEVIRRMANTAPQHRGTPKAAPKEAKVSAGNRGLSRKRSGRAASAKPFADD
jgi:hypothetical protein